MKRPKQRFTCVYECDHCGKKMARREYDPNLVIFCFIDGPKYVARHLEPIRKPTADEAVVGLLVGIRLAGSAGGGPWWMESPQQVRGRERVASIMLNRHLGLPDFGVTDGPRMSDRMAQLAAEAKALFVEVPPEPADFTYPDYGL